MKSYKRKSMLYMNSADSPKLSKKLRRIFEKSNRSQAKNELRNIDVDEIEEDNTELEMKLSWLCYQAEKAVGEGYACTCPDANSEAAIEHEQYLQSLIINAIMKQEEE